MLLPIILNLIFAGSNTVAANSVNSIVTTTPSGPIPTNWVLYIFLTGVAYTLIAAGVQRKLSNPKRTRELQDQIKVLSKEMNLLMKNNAPKEEIEKKQGDLMPLMRESMTLNMKATLILIPSFLVVYYVLIPWAYGWLGHDTLSFVIGNYNISLMYKGLFFVTVFVLGLVTSMSILLYDRKRAKADTLAKLAQEGIKE